MSSSIPTARCVICLLAHWTLLNLSSLCVVFVLANATALWLLCALKGASRMWLCVVQPSCVSQLTRFNAESGAPQVLLADSPDAHICRFSPDGQHLVR